MAAETAMSIDSKPKPSHREQSDDSAGSTPEGEHNAAPNTQDAQPQPKRKGGRKPVSFLAPVTTAYILANHTYTDLRYV